MIEYPNLLLVGRREVVSENNRWLWEMLLCLCEKMRDAWSTRWPDRFDEWSGWNVLACIGPWGKWTFIDLLTFEGLGDTPVPSLKDRWRYVPMLGIVDPLEVASDPPVLYGSSRLLSNSHWPIKLSGTWAKNPKIRMEEIEVRLEELCLSSDPWAQTHSGVAASLHKRGMELVGPINRPGIESCRGPGRWRLRPLQAAPVESPIPRPPPTTSIWQTLDEALL